MDIDTWEAQFIKLFHEKVDEDPLYGYEHLHRKGLSPEKAVVAYLKENPDYLEKIEDITSLAKNEEIQKQAEKLTPEEMVKRAHELQAREEAKKRLSEFCPNCARKIGSKKLCKCGFKR